MFCLSKCLSDIENIIYITNGELFTFSLVTSSLSLPPASVSVALLTPFCYEV